MDPAVKPREIAGVSLPWQIVKILMRTKYPMLLFFESLWYNKNNFISMRWMMFQPRINRQRQDFFQTNEFKETLKTEQDYLAAMETLAGVFQRSIGPFSEEIRPHIKTLVEIAQKLVKNLEKVQQNNIDANERNDLRLARESLMQRFFAVYPVFCKLYMKYSEQNNINPKIFSQIDAAVKREDKRGLESLLIMTIQRGPRYLLLLNAMSKQKGVMDSEQEKEVTDLSKLCDEMMSASNSKVSAGNTSYQFGDLTKRVLATFSSLWKSNCLEQESVQYTTEEIGDLVAEFEPVESSQTKPGM